jgi:hypothetical protein
MKQAVEIDGGSFEFEAVELFHGRGALDPDIAAHNLLLLKRMLDEQGIRFGITYGTLLGAIREQAFIKWDEDVDVFILDEDRSAFHSMLDALRGAGLELVRCEGDLYSLMRLDNYIDVYFFRKKWGRRICNKDSVRSKFLERDGWVEFLGQRFLAPFESRRFLCEIYGVDWETPKRDAPAKPWSSWMKLKETVKTRFPVLLRIKKSLRG